MTQGLYTDENQAMGRIGNPSPSIYSLVREGIRGDAIRKTIPHAIDGRTQFYTY